MRRCYYCGRPAVRCTLESCQFSGWVHERSRQHQCRPLGFGRLILRPFAWAAS